jgi:hypothetical protein
MFTITTRRLAGTAALGVAAGAAFGGGAAAGSGADEAKALACTTRAQECMPAAEFRALMIRSLALNHKYGLGE